ncbi:MAG: glycosyltransferase [Puniceicoccaceae bacterium]|nr:MAG: glycosyltransferase [Puniceicoccaceae bacterium]
MISSGVFSTFHPPKSLRFSIIIPVYNEAENIETVAREVKLALSKIEGECEALFVDDCSTDDSEQILKQLVERDSDFRMIRHRVNSGQSAAVASGFRMARGAWVGTIDGDGQNDPADLPSMLEKAEQLGVDCVTGVRRKRKDTRLKRLSSRLANRFRDWITGDRVSDSACGIRVVRAECTAELPVFNGLHRFMPTLLKAQGFSVEEVDVSHRARMQGVSKYGVHNRLWRGIRDCFGIRWYVNRAVAANRIDVE